MKLEELNDRRWFQYIFQDRDCEYNHYCICKTEETQSSTTFDMSYVPGPLRLHNPARICAARDTAMIGNSINPRNNNAFRRSWARKSRVVSLALWVSHAAVVTSTLLPAAVVVTSSCLTQWQRRHGKGR